MTIPKQTRLLTMAHMGVDPNIGVGFLPPPQIIHLFMGFGTIIFTIHFGVPSFLETSIYLEDRAPLRISGWLRGLLPPFITRLTLLGGLTITVVINHLLTGMILQVVDEILPSYMVMGSFVMQMLVSSAAHFTSTQVKSRKPSYMGSIMNHYKDPY